MDLNELLHAHQVEVMKASAAGDERSRMSHFVKVAAYAEQVRKLRHSARKAPSPSSQSSHRTITYGTYAGNAVPSPSVSPIDCWEDEGGALDPPIVPLPAGIITKVVKEYHVGPYVYHDLALALAEYERQNSHTNFDRR